jgi:hypothetical protein
MDWLQTNWALIALAWEKGAFLGIMINPLGIIASVLVAAVGWFWANGRKYLFLLLFAAWSLAPLHHFTLEGRDFVQTDFHGYGGLSGFANGALFFAGVLAVAIIVLYYILIKD